MRAFIIALGLGLAATGFSGAANTAVAACAIGPGAHGIPNDQKVWPSQTSFVNLTNAYNNGTCTITKSLHKGGTSCLPGRTGNHITVKTKKFTYHVFGYYATVNGQRYRCATR